MDILDSMNQVLILIQEHINVDLKESTIQDNARLFFDGDVNAVPKQAISMGIQNIMEAKKSSIDCLW